ncbi:hypothetical protein G7Y89_g6362 [Cudoniella acicularis]|uniref:Uncharacterized protein n=1 Tax=Cudoniella acicularis TaxID=354080 RepID=A0A8H4RMU2_9HELO|nr:hypothetical protein G7Y89_g6362 [Cudoniella acicularis]
MAAYFSTYMPDCALSDAPPQPLAKKIRTDYHYPHSSEDHRFGPANLRGDAKVTSPSTCAFHAPSHSNHSNLPIPQTTEAGVQPSWNLYQQPSLPFSVPLRQHVVPNEAPVLPVIMATHHDHREMAPSQLVLSGPHNMNDTPLTGQMLQFASKPFSCISSIFSPPTTCDLAPRPLSSMAVATSVQSWQMDEGEQNLHSDPRDLALSIESGLTSDSEQELVCFGMIMGIAAELTEIPKSKSTGTSSAFPVRLHSSGAFTILDEPSVHGKIATESHKMIQGLTEESSLNIQTVCTLEDQRQNAGPKRRANLLRQKVCSLSIILYGPMDFFDDVGEYVEQHGIYLQDPKGCDRNVLYCNPHSLSLSNGESYPLTFDLDQQQTSVQMEGLPQENDLLEVLNTSEPLCETPQPTAIKTQLGSHQKQALTFMLRREKGWALDGSWPDIWETVGTNQGSHYINKISHALQAEAPPQFLGGIIADPMGLGKTLTMIALIASDTDGSYGAQNRLHENHVTPLPGPGKRLTLVVVPLSLLPAWEEQLTEHVYEGGLKWQRHYGKSRIISETESLSDCNIVLTTYQTLSSEWRKSVDLQRSVLFHVQWRRVILDEAHVIRNSDSQVARAICALEADSRWAVTGTPLQNRLSDLGTLLKFLRPYPYGDAKQFDTDIGQLWKAGNLEEAVKRLKRLIRCLVLRRPKATIDLPARHNLLYPLDFNPEELSIYQEVKARALRRIDEALFSTSDTSSAYANALRQIDALRMICNLGSHYRPSGQTRKLKNRVDDWDNRAQQAFDSQREFSDVSCYLCKLTLEATESSRSIELSCGHTPPCSLARVSVNDSANQAGLASNALLHPEALPTKVAALVSQVKALEKDVKCVVFSYWRSTLDLIQSALEHAAIATARFDGSLSPKDRQASVDKFRKDPSVRVMLLTLSCGAVGLTLTVATRAYLMEPHWNPTVEEQALARIHRIGQKKEITTIRFFMRDSFEEHVIEVQKKKKHLADVLLSSQNDASSDDNASRLEGNLSDTLKPNISEFLCVRHPRNPGMEHGPRGPILSMEPSLERASMNQEPETDAAARAESQGTDIGVSHACEPNKSEAGLNSKMDSVDIVDHTIQHYRGAIGETYDTFGNGVEPNIPRDRGKSPTSEDVLVNNTVRQDKGANCNDPSILCNYEGDKALQLGETANDEATVTNDQEEGSSLKPPTAKDDDDHRILDFQEEEMPRSPEIESLNLVSGESPDLITGTECHSVHTQDEYTQHHPSSYHIKVIASPFSIILPRWPEHLNSRKDWHFSPNMTDNAALLTFPNKNRFRLSNMHKRRTGYTACDQHFTSKKRFPGPVSNYPTRIEKEGLPLIMEYWTCTVCNIEMQLQSRNPHLSGKRHAAAAEEYQERILQATRTQEAGKQWTCTICNIEMQMQSRDSHLSGNRHAIATQSRLEPRTYFPECNNAASSSSATAKTLPANSGVGGITEDTIYATSDMTEVYGALAVLVWQCTTCSCYVPLSVRQSHLSSIDHVQKLVEAIKVTCMAIPQPQLQVSGNDLGERENLDYQDVVCGAKALAAYLVNHSSYKEAIPEFSAMNPLLESMAQPNRKSKPETCAPTCPDCRTDLVGDNETIHSCPYPQFTPVPSTGPLDSFFLSFSGYQYDPSIPPAESFRSFRRGLRRWSDWDGYSPDTWKEYEEDIYTRYQAALTQEFNLWFGTEDDIRAWHSLCRAIAIQPLPATCELCREAVRNRHVNIVDLIQWAREREVGQVKIFETVKELSTYAQLDFNFVSSDLSSSTIQLLPPESQELHINLLSMVKTVNTVNTMDKPTFSFKLFDPNTSGDNSGSRCSNPSSSWESGNDLNSCPSAEPTMKSPSNNIGLSSGRVIKKPSSIFAAPRQHGNMPNPFALLAVPIKNTSSPEADTKDNDSNLQLAANQGKNEQE